MHLKYMCYLCLCGFELDMNQRSMNFDANCDSWTLKVLK